jgi:hypothetical protein
VLLINRKLRVTDNVEKKDMRDLRLNFVRNLVRHTDSLKTRCKDTLEVPSRPSRPKARWKVLGSARLRQITSHRDYRILSNEIKHESCGPKLVNTRTIADVRIPTLARCTISPGLPLLEIARVLARLYHVASRIVNANRSIL